MEKEWEGILYQQYVLKKHIGLNFEEMNNMTAEERNKLIQWIKDDYEREKQEYEKAKSKH